MTNLERWTLLAKDVMDKLALSDDPQRLVVIATALAGAASVSAAEARREEALWWYHKFAWPIDDEHKGKVVEAIDRTAMLEDALEALSDDGARAGKQ